MSKKSRKPKPEEYRCDVCGQVFQKCPGADEEAFAEAIEVYGASAFDQPMGIACDDCHKEMLRWMKKLGFKP